MTLADKPGRNGHISVSWETFLQQPKEVTGHKEAEQIEKERHSLHRKDR